VVQTITPEEYIESVIQEIDALVCNNDNICQSRESNTCSDCKSSSFSINNPSDFEIIQTILENTLEDAIEQGAEIPEDEPTLNCLQECSLLPCKATECPKLVCYAKCFCKTYSFDASSINLANDGKKIT
jgi:hypothetical protein